MKKNNKKDGVTVHSPLLGCNILNLTKLALLEFYYDFINVFFKKECYQLMYIDTDSQYFALTSSDYKDLVKPEMYNEFHDTSTTLVGKHISLLRGNSCYEKDVRAAETTTI